LTHKKLLVIFFAQTILNPLRINRYLTYIAPACGRNLVLYVRWVARKHAVNCFFQDSLQLWNYCSGSSRRNEELQTSQSSGLYWAVFKCAYVHTYIHTYIRVH